MRATSRAVHPRRDHLPQSVAVSRQKLVAGQPVAATRPLHELLPIELA